MHGKLTQHTLYASATALLVGVLSLILVQSHETQEKTDPVFSREVVAYELLSNSPDPLVKYEYVGDPLPQRLSEREDVSLRTESSYAELIAIEHEGTKEERKIYRGTFFTKPTFTEQDGQWYYIEHATTTESAFNQLRKANALASIFWRTVHAASIAPFPEAGDGYAFESDVGDIELYIVSFSDCLDATDSGSGSHSVGTSHTATTIFVWSQYRSVVAGQCNAYVGFLPFNTSSITAGSTITDAVLSIYVTAKSNGVNDGTDHIAVYQTNQASTANLTSASILNIASTQGSATTDLSLITTSAYNTLTLNATGRGWIKTAGQSSNCGGGTGYTCLGLAEGHYFTGSITSNASGNEVDISSSETTGTSQDPYLTITYTPGSSFSFWQFQDF